MELKKIKGEVYNGIEGKDIVNLPTFTLTDQDLPEIADWKVGDSYKLVIEVEQVSMRQGSEWGGDTNKDNTRYATFKLKKVGIKKEEKKEDYQNEYASKRSGFYKK